MHNRLSLSDFAAMSAEQRASVSLEEMSLLQEQVKAMTDAAKRFDALVHSELAGRFADHLTGTGTLHVEQDGVKVKIDRPKRVDWDQDGLAELFDNLAASGWRSADFIGVKYEVSEKTYSALPSQIAPGFEPLRTVKPGKPKFTISVE